MADAMSVHYLTNADVRATLARIDPLEPVADALRAHATGDAILPAEASLYWRNATGEIARSLALPGFVPGPVAGAGVKIINANPSNPGRGLPRASGLLLLFDPESARVRWILQAEVVSSVRTAAVSMLGARLFAPRAATMAVIGAGPLAFAHLDLAGAALAEVRTIRIHDLEPDRAGRAVEHARAALPDVEVLTTPTAQGAVEGADVVIAATTTTTPYLQPAWLTGTGFVANVGLDDCTEETLVGCDTLVVDSWALVAEDRRRLLGKLIAAQRVVAPGERGGSGRRAVDAELGALLAEGPMRSSGSTHRGPPVDGLTVLNPFGMGIEDVALGTAVCAVADRLGLGVDLPA